ncbi:MAG TPA: hypothetical protein V6C89_16365 [Drouetiella sp.]|jgi:hypothetical protein
MTSGDSKSYRPGQSILCRVEAPEAGGYLVTVMPSEIKGFLPSQDPLDIGKVVPATFVCMNGERALLTFAYMIGTTERVQLSTSSDSINAFSVWADSYPTNMKTRRAIDVVMPSIDGNQRTMTSNDHTLEELMQHIENTKFTGCLKAQNEERLSRSAALLFEGRVVGCIYGTKSPKPQPYTTETAMYLMISDLQTSGTDVQLYTLPEEVILSMSSLFLGCPIEGLPESNTPTVAIGLLKEFEKRGQTACLTLSTDGSGTISVSFVYAGKYIGSFLVEKQQFMPSVELPLQLPSEYDNARLDASFLPDEMISESIQYGYIFNKVVENFPNVPQSQR